MVSSRAAAGPQERGEDEGRFYAAPSTGGQKRQRLTGPSSTNFPGHQAPTATSSAQPSSGNQATVSQGLAADVEVQVVGIPGVGVPADMPHCRTQCANVPWGSTPNSSTCPNCFCYVCNAPAPCQLWADDEEQDVHCNASEKDSVWQQRREAAKAAGVAPAANANNAAKQPAEPAQAAVGAMPEAPQLPQPALVQPVPAAVPGVKNETSPNLAGAQAFAAAFGAGLATLAHGLVNGFQQAQQYQGLPVAPAPDSKPEPHAQKAAAPSNALALAAPAAAAGACLNADGQDYLPDLSPDEERELQAVLEGIEHREGLGETEPPPGKLRVQLHAYQKQGLTWMLRREGASNVQGGILADEQGLGKTVQMLALIVTQAPSRDNAARALKSASHQQTALELHPLGRSAREQRAEREAARLNAAFAGGASGSSNSTSAGLSGSGSPGVKTEEAPSKKKPGKAKEMQWTRCGKGPHCTCARCNKAKEQQKAAMQKEAKRQAALKQEARKKAKEQAKAAKANGGVPMAVAPLTATVQAADGGVVKRTLVVCPLCVASQWVDEMQSKTPQLSVALYHGPNRAQRFPASLLASYDVVVTTYDILGMEHQMSPVGSVFRVRWFRAILDEAHVIRNKRTLAAQTCTALQAERRWCLTGTPIVNSASDVFSLFCFLRFTPFSDINVFNHQIRNQVQTVRNRRAPTLHARRAGFEELRCAMLAVTLRRTKDMKGADGRPIVVLPPKMLQTMHVVLSPDEQAFYRSMEDKSQEQFNVYVREGWRQNYHHILVLLLRLRQACIHPYLAQVRGDQEAEATELHAGDQVAGAGLDDARKLHLYSKLVAPDASECPICMDAAQGKVVTACGHGPMCLECITQALQHQEAQQGRSLCPLCRSQLAPSQLYGAADLLPPELAADEAVDEVDDAPAWLPSTKLSHVIKVLDGFRREDELAAGQVEHPEQRVTKTCVFSQFTKALDMLEHELAESGYSFMRLDGRMNISQRAESVRAFAKDLNIRVLLCSTKAASLGLNLTMATRVILLDSWWNGATEDQAIDRCHRLGQTREVHVVKIAMKLSKSEDTVEQRIINMQEEKRAIAQAALGDGDAGAAGGATALTLAELRRLFGLHRAQDRRTPASGAGARHVPMWEEGAEEPMVDEDKEGDTDHNNGGILHL